MNNSEYAPQTFAPPAVSQRPHTINTNTLHSSPCPDKDLPPCYNSIRKPAHPSCSRTSSESGSVGGKSLTPSRPAPPVPLQLTQSLPLSSPRSFPPASSRHPVDPNIKRDTLRREKHISNYEREQYQHNLTRTPSIEPKKVGPLTPSSQYSTNGFSWDRALTHVEVHTEIGVSEC